MRPVSSYLRSINFSSCHNKTGKRLGVIWLLFFQHELVSAENDKIGRAAKVCELTLSSYGEPLILMK